MRDAFLMKLYDIAKRDTDLVFISAEMGAPALDKFRKDFGNRFINIGIAEQNMIAVATGLAKEGKKVYTYAIAPFITSRCYEFTKVDASLMNIPIKLIGIGAGFGYDDSGPTHHTTEDISIMRTLPGLEIFSPSDSNLAAEYAEHSYKSEKPCYIRFERKLMPQLYSDNINIERGFEELKKGKETAIVSTGYMTHSALAVADKLSDKNIGVIDLYKLKPINEEFVDAIRNYKKIISLEEHLLAGGLGSIVSEIICDNNLDTRLKRIGIDDEYFYLYGRNNLHKHIGLDEESIINNVKSFL